MINSEELYWNERYNLEERNINIYYQDIGYMAIRPSTVYKPKLFRDGNQWCALFGEDIQSGVCGFGESPEKAFTNFDNEWSKKIA